MSGKICMSEGESSVTIMQKDWIKIYDNEDPENFHKNTIKANIT